MMRSELLQRARAHLAAEHYAEAGGIASVYSREVDPLDPESHFIVSQAAHATRQFSLALTEAGNAVVLAPQNAAYRERFLTAIGRLSLDPSTPPLVSRGAGELLARISQAPTTNERRVPRNPADGIDLVLPMQAPFGSELNLLETAKILRRSVPTRIWSDVPAHPHLIHLDPTIQTITEDSIPAAHTLVFMGLFPRPPVWLDRSPAQRIVLRYNVWNILQLLRWLGATALSSKRIDIAFASQALKDAVGIDGTVMRTFIDLDQFSPRGPSRPVNVIGRLSRDELNKYHPDDPALYRSLLQAGFEVRIMGGTQLAPFLTKHDRLNLLPALAVPASTFIRGLDVFLYRTGRFYESFGRVVMEAMGCGLPVVCHRQGGYAEIIRHEENGFVFETNEEAFTIVANLRTDASAARRVGEAARDTIVNLHAQKFRDRLVDYYAGA